MTKYSHRNFALKFQAIAEKTGYMYFLPHPVCTADSRVIRPGFSYKRNVDQRYSEWVSAVEVARRQQQLVLPINSSHARFVRDPIDYVKQAPSCGTTGLQIRTRATSCGWLHVRNNSQCSANKIFTSAAGRRSFTRLPRLEVAACVQGNEGNKRRNVQNAYMSAASSDFLQEMHCRHRREHKATPPCEERAS